MTLGLSVFGCTSAVRGSLPQDECGNGAFARRSLYIKGPGPALTYAFDPTSNFTQLLVIGQPQGFYTGS